MKADGPVEQLPAEAHVSDLLNKDDDEFAKAIGVSFGEEEVVEQPPKETPTVTPEQRVKQAPVKEMIAKDNAKREAIKKALEGESEEKPPVPPSEEGVEEEEVELEEAAQEDKAGEQEEEKTEEEEEAHKLLTQFQVFDDEGEIEVPRELKLTFKADGKVRENVPLDKVVLLAQMGFYNQKREDEVAQTKQENEALVQYLVEYDSSLKALRKELDDMLDDEAYLEAARQERAKRNSPEARAARAEEDAKRARDEAQQAQNDATAKTYIQEQVYPIFAKLTQTYPEVSENEVFGIFSRVVMPLTGRNGKVPLNRLSEVKILAEGIITDQVKEIASTRREEKTATKKQQDEELKKEKLRSFLAKKRAAQATKPQGTPPTRQPKKPVTYESADDWAETFVDKELASLVK